MTVKRRPSPTPRQNGGSGWGGKRKGAGKPRQDKDGLLRRRVVLFMTEPEEAIVRKTLEDIRNNERS